MGSRFRTGSALTSSSSSATPHAWVERGRWLLLLPGDPSFTVPTPALPIISFRLQIRDQASGFWPAGKCREELEIVDALRVTHHRI